MKATKDPFADLVLDPEEQWVEDHAEEFVSVENLAEVKKEMEEAARNTLRRNRQINLRMMEGDLIKIRNKAAEVGVPYQTLVQSVLHRYANDSTSKF